MVIENLVPTEKMAAEIGGIYILHTYSKTAAERQKPYRVEDKDQTWIVRGAMNNRTLGGTFEIEISKSDGRVLRINHSRWWKDTRLAIDRVELVREGERPYELAAIVANV